MREIQDEIFQVVRVQVIEDSKQTLNFRAKCEENFGVAMPMLTRRFEDRKKRECFVTASKIKRDCCLTEVDMFGLICV